MRSSGTAGNIGDSYRIAPALNSIMGCLGYFKIITADSGEELDAVYNNGFGGQVI